MALQLRSAAPKEIPYVRKILLQSAMNPLSLHPSNVLVAVVTDPLTSKQDTVVGFGQIRPLEDQFYELASLFVLPEYRHQGIGTKLVGELLRRHDESMGTKGSSLSSTVCLLTLKPTTSFYQKHGFSVVDSPSLLKLPSSIQMEHAAGTALSFFLGNDLVCMVRKQ